MISENYLPTMGVVIPNRNDSAYLATCLNSVLQQSVRPDEIIFVDDQSSDNSLDMARDILNGIPGSQVIANPTCLGTMGALNEGLKCISSDYVLFLASNDYLINGIFARAKSSIAASTDIPGVWSAMVWAADESGRRMYLYPSPVVALKDTFFSQDECIRLAMMFGNWFTGTTLIFHRETLWKIGGFDTEYQGLADLLAALTVASIKGAFFSPEPFGVIRLHSGGYLWRTLIDLDGLEVILAKIEARAPKLSPILFSPKFCGRIKHRFRFAAIRSFQDNQRIIRHSNWLGAKYKVLLIASRLLGNNKTLRTMLAFVILRPFDVLAMIWYRLMGMLWLMARRVVSKRHDESNR
jgi:glycosyltransferase involved in cell wall biosynthesis